MNRIQKRLARMSTIVGVLGVVTMGTAPAFAADSGISYYKGSADGQALNVTVSPNAIASVDLSLLRSELKGLPNGVGDTIDGLIGETLTNVTADINVTANTAHAEGVAAKGTDLTDGTATTTPASVNSAALAQQVALLKKALKNIPAGTLSALTEKLQPLLDSPALSVAQKLQLTTDLNLLSAAVAENICSPSVNVLDSKTAKFGESFSDQNVSFQPVGFCAGSSLYTVGPFVAKALADGSVASNNLTNLNLVPTGGISVPSLTNAINNLVTDLKALEAVINNTASGLGLGTVGTLAGGVINQVTGTLTTGVLADAINQANATVNKVAVTLQAIYDLGLDGLQMNQILGTGPAPGVSLTQVNRDADGAHANGLSNLAHVDAVKVNNPTLLKVLAAIPGAGTVEAIAANGLVTVDGIKGTANVTLDGTHDAQTTGSSQLVDIHVLGKSLKQLAGVDLNTVLAEGTSCKISVPGKSTCAGIPSVVPSVPAVDGLLTINLARGVVEKSAPSKTFGSASVTALQVTVSLDCSKVPALSTLNQTLSALPVGLSLCGGSGTQALAGARTANAATSSETGVKKLVDIRLGYAAAALTTDVNTPLTPGNPPQAPPNTGNNIWILAAFAGALVLAGAGFQFFRSRPTRA